MALMLTTVFAAALGLAISIHLALVWLGTAPGLVAAAALVAVALAPRGPVHSLYRALGLPEPALRSGAAPRVATRRSTLRAST
jgi:hypothetical protein